MYARRTTFVSFRLDERGGWIALAALAGREITLSDTEARVLRSLPPDTFAQVPEADRATVAGLANAGLAMLDDEHGEIEMAAEMRRREEVLRHAVWDPLAAATHFTSRLSGVAMDDPPIDDAWIERFGPSPSPFHSVGDASAAIDLPLEPTQHGGVFGPLAIRRTTRFYDTTRSIGLDQLSQILRWTFGVQGTYRQHPRHTMVHKAGPSPSGLHPTEAYPALLRVDGVAPGIYHYAADRHVLEPVRLMPAEELAVLLRALAVSQQHPGAAAATVLLTQRHGRLFWKYRWSVGPYHVMLQEVGVLAQTLYLVAAEMGLAAFLLTAVNHADIDQVLGIDSYVEGAAGMLGVGVPLANAPPDQLQPPWQPFTPRSTR